jgi:hypothetical protein
MGGNMPSGQLPDLPSSNQNELRAIARRLSPIGLRGSREYLNELTEHLAAHALVKLPPGAHHTTEIIDTLHSMLDIEFEYQIVLAALHRLHSKEEVYAVDSESDETARFGTSADTINRLVNDYQQHLENETEVVRDWLREVSLRHPGLSAGDLESLRNDLVHFCYWLFSLYSIEVVTLYFEIGDALRHLGALKSEKAFADTLPKRSVELARIRNLELPRFIVETSKARHMFLAGQLNSVVLLQMLKLDPQAARLATRQLPGGTIFLDTNVLFTLFGLQGSNLQAATEKLLAVSRGLGYVTAVSPRTIEEYENSIDSYVGKLESLPMVPLDLAKEALSSTLGGELSNHFWKRSMETRGYLSASAYIALFKNIGALLKYHHISVDQSEDAQVGLQVDRLMERESLRLAGIPYTNSRLTHDVHMKLLILQLRSSHNGKSLPGRAYWLLTQDRKLIADDRLNRSKRGQDLPYCVLPSELMNVLMPLATAVTSLGRDYNFERMVTASASPLLHSFKVLEPAMVQEMITRIAGTEDLSPDIVARVTIERAFEEVLSGSYDRTTEDELDEPFGITPLLSADLVSTNRLRIKVQLPDQLAISALVRLVGLFRVVEHIYTLYSILGLGNASHRNDLITFLRNQPYAMPPSTTVLGALTADLADFEPLRLVSMHYGSQASFDLLGVGKILEITRDTIVDIAWRGKHTKFMADNERQAAELDRMAKQVDIAKSKIENEKAALELVAKKLEIDMADIELITKKLDLLDKLAGLQLPEADRKLLAYSLLPKSLGMVVGVIASESTSRDEL